MPTGDDRYKTYPRRIAEAKYETDDITTLRFFDDFEARPGQFLMVWLPGEGEVPMAISYVEKKKGITVRNVGPTTEKLKRLGVGDRIWIRGPYGIGYRLRGEHILCVAGGTGIASLAPYVEGVRMARVDVDMIVGVRTANQVYMVERLEKCGARVTICTDDGSLGEKGTAADLTTGFLNRKRYQDVVTCGPEQMMKKVTSMAGKKGIQFQASLERYLKCGIGICDSCVIGSYHVCKDGPVFTEGELSSCEDFGRFRRAPSGKREEIS